ncbi:hypothetical protein LP422_24305 [Janibacter limosus]|uniref:hypothetical protein n=1 Tax=Janibacter limosus TaxID=53458 RepID=UPI0021537484|nr:hypothetical protein [Janibacter limosus]WKV16754.1 hypothetical protein LP422_24305 [Janibacter limosus]
MSIARAIASGRPVILLDEPVAHLDHPTAEAVVADLLQHAGERSVIMVTHHGVGPGPHGPHGDDRDEGSEPPCPRAHRWVTSSRPSWTCCGPTTPATGSPSARSPTASPAATSPTRPS